MSFPELIPVFLTGHLEGLLHPQCGLRLPDKRLLLGPELITEYLENHPEWYVGMRQISPDSPVTVTFRNDAGSLIKVFSIDKLIGKIIEFHPNEIRQRIKLTIEYDGTDFAGFQTQKADQRTVQQELETALTLIHAKPTSATGASRTDAGVHAFGQVVHFDTRYDFDESKWMMILNHALPPDLRVVRVEKVHPLFHARYDVIGKEYRYVINLGSYSALQRNREWTPEDRIDLEMLRTEMNKIIGTHDFSSFCKGANDDSVRTIHEVRMESEGNHVVLTFAGDGFLHNMIRLLVGSMVQIAAGKSERDILGLLAEKNRKKTQFLAPAGGLYLVKVSY
jgi:tRNA pseudouridine38-40 synthase